MPRDVIIARFKGWASSGALHVFADREAAERWLAKKEGDEPGFRDRIDLEDRPLMTVADVEDAYDHLPG